MQTPPRDLEETFPSVGPALGSHPSVLSKCGVVSRAGPTCFRFALMPKIVLGRRVILGPGGPE